MKAAGLGWSQFSWTGSQVRVTFRSPATIQATTRFVLLRGQIKRPEDDRGAGGQPCVVSFEAAYRRDPFG